MTDKCWNCIHTEGMCKNDASAEFMCKSTEYRYYKYNPKKPEYNFEVAKQLLFDAAMDLEYGNYTWLAEISAKIMDVIKNLDKMKVIE